MTAKSLPRLFAFLDSPTLAHWGRRAASVFVLAASVLALVLILVEQHGLPFHNAYARVLPSEARQDGGADRIAASAHQEWRERVIAEFLARRYRVSEDVALNFVTIAHAAGHQIGLDPLLILAVMAVESRFNPIAESLVGAKGLMQIIPKYHADKLNGFGGEKAVFDPATNIMVGAQILKEYLRRTGNLGTALQMYAGALNDDQDVYTNRVMSEKRRLQRVLKRSAPPQELKTAANDAASGYPAH